MKMNLYILILSFAAITSCGIKGDPLPPSEVETVQKAEPDGIKVTPATNTSQKENLKKKKVNEN